MKAVRARSREVTTTRAALIVVALAVVVDAFHGYGVLMLDRRGEGDYNARWWGGEPDLEAAVDYPAARHHDRSAASDSPSEASCAA